jgi:predicted ATP-grasp superfamily ATP-dependent carboligase
MAIPILELSNKGRKMVVGLIFGSVTAKYILENGEVDCHMVQEYISAVGMKKSMKDRFQMD